MQTSEGNGRALLSALGFGMAGMAAVLWLTLAPGPQQRTVALVFPPSTNADEAFRGVARADGRIVQFGNFAKIVVARFDSLTPDMAVARSGALFALNPQILEGCLAPTRNTNNGLTS